MLLAAVLLSPANGFVGGVVAYERDTATFYYPLFTWAAQQLREGQFPLWTPEIFGGYPAFADGEIGLASPIVLLALVALPVDTAFVLLRLFHVAVAALGAYWLARAWRLPRSASVLAGLTFSLGSFLQAHLHHENIVRTAAWLPLILACWERAMRGSGHTQRRWLLAAGGVLGLSSVGLHPEILLINLLTLGAYALLRWVLLPGPWRGWRPGLARGWTLGVMATVPVAIGLGLGAAQLLPLAELASLSARATAAPYADAANQSLIPLGLLQLVFPFLFRDADSRQWGLWVHWEAYLYVGLAPLVLALVALTRTLRRRVVLVWAVLGTLGLFVSLGQYTPLDLFALLWRAPGLGWLRAPGRFELVPVLALAMLAAHGLATVQAQARARTASRFAVPLLVLLVVPVAAAAIAALHGALVATPDAASRWIAQDYLALPRDTRPLTAQDVYRGLRWFTDLQNPRTGGALLGVLLVGTILLAWQAAGSARLRAWPGWTALMLGVTTLDLLIFSWSIHPREALATLARPDPAAAAVRDLAAQRPSDQAPFRVHASPQLEQVAANRLLPLGLQMVGGYSSLDLSRYRDFMRRLRHADDDLLDLWNVRYVLKPQQVGPFPSYGGVQYVAPDALLRSPGASALGEESFRVPAQVETAEVRLITAVVGGRDLPDGEVVAEVRLRSADGTILAQRPVRAGLETMDWGWDDLTREGRAPLHRRVEQAGESSERLSSTIVAKRLLSYGRLALNGPVSAATLEIRSVLPRGELMLHGLAVVDRAGATYQLTGRQKSKYREVARLDGVVVLENTAAYPRAFLVPRLRTAAEGMSLEVMERRPFVPNREVVVAARTLPAADASLAVQPLPPDTPAEGGVARIDRYADTEVEVSVSSPNNGYLVLTDMYYPGWQALVDGVERPILRGDVLFRVVKVPAGTRQVLFRYQPVSVWVGLAVSALAAALVAGAFFFDTWARRPRAGGPTPAVYSAGGFGLERILPGAVRNSWTLLRTEGQ